MFILANSNNDEDKLIWPKLFSDEIWIVILDETERYELKSLIDDPEMINGNISTNEIKWWMMESFGFGYGKAKYDKKIADHLMEVLRQIAWKVQEKIDNCLILQNMFGDKIKKNKDLPISFQYYKWGRRIRCNEITDQQWEYLIYRTGGVDPRKEMKAGDCFCDEKWTKDAECDENKPKPTSAATGSKKKRDDSPDDHYSFSSGINYITNLLSTAVFDFPIVCIGGHLVKS
jgi:hypothetical protein